MSRHVEMHWEPFIPDLSAAWDRLIGMSQVGTFLHTRRFFGYHLHRFDDCSLVLKRENKLIAVLPLARSPTDREVVVSHPGSTFGGIIHDGSMRAEDFLAAFSGLKELNANSLNASKLVYKSVPHIYHASPEQSDLYALFRFGASLSRCDLSATIDLDFRMAPSKRRTRCTKNAAKQDLEVVQDAKFLEAFWEILSENLWTRFQVRPVHTAQELLYLKELFPYEIEWFFALKDKQVVSGIVLFHSRAVCHAQYMASSVLGKQVFALDKLIWHSLDVAKNRGQRYYDFGISTEKHGQYLNEGLHQYKKEFGAGTTVYNTYELSLL